MPVALGTVASGYKASAAGPIPMTGLAGWWDANDASTFTYSSGVLVSEWRDKTTGARHLVQATVAKQPSRNGSRDSKPTVVFNNGPYLAYTGNTSLNVGSVSVFVVFADGAPASDANAAVFLARGGASDYNDPNSFFVSTVDVSTYVEAVRLASLAGVAGNGLMPWSVTTIVFKPDGSASAYRDGTIGTAGTTTPGTFGVATGGYVVGERWIAGGIYGVKFNGDIGEIIVYDRVLSTVERQQVESYLTNKWMAAPPIPSTGLAGWWDAADAASITASGGVVSQWNDKSGLGRHVTQSPTGPTTGTRTMNGRNVLDFTSHTLQASGFTLTQPMMMVVALRADAVAGQFIGYVIGAAFLFDSGKWAMYSAGYLYSNVAADTAAHVVTGLLNGPTSQIWVDGAAQTPGNPGSTGTNAFRFGTSSGGSSPFDGTIAEIVVYDRVLSTVERQQVESYLKTKWGTP